MMKFLPVLAIMLLIASCQENVVEEVEKYGAVADGKTLSTEAIQTAIDMVSEKGGGKVILGKGTYVSGSLILKSNVELTINENSQLLGSTDPRDYRKIEAEGMPTSPKTDDNSKLALILAHKTQNITISGAGVIDGRGADLMNVIDSLHENGIWVIPGYDKSIRRLNETKRPKLIQVMESNHVRVDGITLKNSAVWVQSYELCENLWINNVKVESRAFWNNDGMDITDCRNVQITNCNVNAADDGICLKSYYPGHFNDSIYIANCTIRTSASAIKFGTASIGGFKNVKIENIKVFDTFRSMIAIESVDGGDIENIHVSNMVGKNTGNAFFIRLGHRSGEKPGYVRNITIKNLKCEVPFGRPDKGYAFEGPMPREPHNQYPAPIAGIPGHYIETVTLENIEITYPGKSSKDIAYIDLNRLDDVPEKIIRYPEYSQFGELPSWGIYARHVRGLFLNNVRLLIEDEDFRPPMVFDDIKGLSLRALNLPKNNYNIVTRGVEWRQDQPSDQLSVIKVKATCSPISDGDLLYRFKESKRVTLSSDTKDAKIYYTLDGKVPDQNSPLYTKPILLTQKTILKAISFTDEYFPSKVFKKTYASSLLDELPDGYPKIRFEKPPKKYGKPDGSQLIDGEFGSEIFRDGKWTGINEEDLVMTFDLGEIKKVHQVQLSTLTATSSWRFPPSSISVTIGMNQEDMVQVVKATYGQLKGEQKRINRHELEFSRVKGRFVKVIVRNYGKLPDWHEGTGKLPWIFVDEINID